MDVASDGPLPDCLGATRWRPCCEISQPPDAVIAVVCRRSHVDRLLLAASVATPRPSPWWSLTTFPNTALSTFIGPSASGSSGFDRLMNGFYGRSVDFAVFLITVNGVHHRGPQLFVTGVDRSQAWEVTKHPPSDRPRFEKARPVPDGAWQVAHPARFLSRQRCIQKNPRFLVGLVIRAQRWYLQRIKSRFLSVQQGTESLDLEVSHRDLRVLFVTPQRIWPGAISFQADRVRRCRAPAMSFESQSTHLDDDPVSGCVVLSEMAQSPLPAVNDPEQPSTHWYLRASVTKWVDGPCQRPDDADEPPRFDRLWIAGAGLEDCSIDAFRPSGRGRASTLEVGLRIQKVSP